MIAPVAQHYDGPSAIRQKIRALAQRSQTQARDIWDLDHLFRLVASTVVIPPAVSALLPIAIERAIDLGYGTYEAQVISYLASEDQELYGDKEAWDQMQERVVTHLVALQ